MQTTNENKNIVITPNCMRCKFHRLTYEAKTPYMCLALGFKSKISPSREVKINSGMECQLFEPK